MLSSSASEGSSLNSKRRSSENLDELDPSLLKRFMNLLWEEREVKEHFAEREWKRLGNTVSKKKPKLSLPFTEAISVYQDLFEDSDDILYLKEDLDTRTEKAASTSEEQAATALLDNALWTGVQEHVVVQNETRGRTIIDLVLIAAIEIAQDEVASNDFVDKSLGQRHGFDVADKKKYPGVQSWLLLHQEVKIPDQDLKVGLAFHGVLDYMVAVVPKEMLIPTQDKSNFFGAGLSALLSPQQFAKSMVYIQEAKSLTTMESNEAEAQVIVQGATMCKLTNRPNVTNVLTNGHYWTFYVISKKSKSKFPGGDKREKLFRYSKTRPLNVLRSEDLPIILRLLKAAILFSPEEFASVAETGRVPPVGRGIRRSSRGGSSRD
ncbi:hypothetical protein DFH09DRAFT_366019 [Mycena vulgaris]|nr:hypothetical protein DFH09DRAFT_366019 [Mycena vulgaris]